MSHVFGRIVHALMTDLISFMGRLVDAAGNILGLGVDGRAIYDKLVAYGIEDVGARRGGKSADKVCQCSSLLFFFFCVLAARVWASLATFGGRGNARRMDVGGSCVPSDAACRGRAL
ncbi:hypothetical protein B0H19DRAFT_1384691 [Mycena capillaripes]|nr:hypothetical protein B0H19DRAFT_1384691 [Mycena capillaripes]